ncbi:hypothetical protein F889_01540 [Acinetobacter colistiniresistens]|uniref:Uncharacterized protein n=1 Tax=Acinetobacter colistiniresistens TaxID=280145 RepID=N9R8D9_9GAMM|nr:hypothetical protein [Acinetobacter colistiniresistens]ENX34900.1 hypothetical protein F889_01540 [Acinetobacter colistiniresistens]
MTLIVNVQENKNVSEWCKFKDENGAVLAEFKIRGISYKPYRVAIERASNQVASKGYDVSAATILDKLYPELLLECAACHLLEDWKGVVLCEKNNNGELIKTTPGYTPENATKLFNLGDIGPIIWAFVKSESERIQSEADEYKDEVVGKLSTSTNGSSSAQKKKRTNTVKNNQQ